jgi:AP-3 complex subunit delta-1
LPSSLAKLSITRAKKSPLEVDSSGLSALSLAEGAENQRGSKHDFERRQAEEEEMAKAMKEVERLRLEMQRAQERIQPRDAPDEGTVVRRKKKKKPRVELLGEPTEEGANGDGGLVTKRKKKKKRREDESEPHELSAGDEQPPEPLEEAAPMKTKRKKKRQVVFDDGEAAA